MPVLLLLLLLLLMMMMMTKTQVVFSQAFSLFVSLYSQVIISLILEIQINTFNHSSDSTVFIATAQVSVKRRTCPPPISYTIQTTETVAKIVTDDLIREKNRTRCVK